MIPRQVSHHMTEQPHSIGTEATAKKARETMREFGYHHLPVLKGGIVVGMVSERDLRVAEFLNKDAEVTVGEIMNDEPFMVERDADIKDVVKAMHAKGVSSAMVKGTANSPWGIFTTTDAIRLLLAVL